MAPDASSEPELDDSRSRSVAALYLRLADALERSAVLAEDHAARLSGKESGDVASSELAHAKRAHDASQRCRDLAARMG